MVAKRYPSPVQKPASPFDKLRRLKNNYGDDVSEQARMKRGPFMPANKPTPPVKTSANGVTTAAPTGPSRLQRSVVKPPAPTRLDPTRPGGYVKTRGTVNEFMAGHPVLAGKKGAARDKFLGNHPRINANVKEFDTNTALEAKQAAILRRLKRVTK